jgi:hypothetical protein
MRIGKQLMKHVSQYFLNKRSFNWYRTIEVFTIRGTLSANLAYSAQITDSQKVAYYKTHFSRINRAVVELISYEKCRQDFWQIAANSTVRNNQDFFWDFCGISFFHEVVNRICRLTDKQNFLSDLKVYSLRAILSELSRDQTLLSRTRYIGENKPSVDIVLPKEGVQWVTPNNFRRLNEEFDRLAGVGEQFFPKSLLKSDIKRLDKVCKRIRKYRNKFLAHTSADAPNETPIKTLEIVKSIDEITTLARKYFLLFNCASYLHEISSGNLTEIFRKAWIQNDSHLSFINEKIENNRAELRKLTTLDWN